jgi:predicted MFS family arabinose efflux permease
LSIREQALNGRKLKLGYFVVEGLNSFATVYYLYYLYFFLQKEFGFGNKANLLVAALSGAVNAVGAFYGGRFAQRQGYFTALKVGIGLMIAALALGACVHTAPAQICAMAIMVAGMCFTWPTLEALVTEGEPPANVPRMVGIYNVVWSSTGALAYFAGGAMLERFGPGTMFYVPLVIEVVELGMVLALGRMAYARANSGRTAPELASDEKFRSLPRVEALEAGIASTLPTAARASIFRRIAWVANPFAYIAINTLIAVMPAVSARLGLSIAQAGFCGSVWCFSRVAAFLGLWFWPGWHYRFGWLLSAFVAMIATFLGIVTAQKLSTLILMQLAFGAATGLMYYSSLFYSMDLSDTKGAHGGIHEAVIGLGNFTGPAVGAASLHFLTAYPNSGVVAVSILLVAGLCGMIGIWYMGKSRSDSP